MSLVGTVAEEDITKPLWPKPENDNSLDILEARRPNCLMPLWSDNSRTGKVCGKTRIHETIRDVVVYHSPYCAGCHRLAYQVTA